MCRHLEWICSYQYYVNLFDCETIYQRMEVLTIIGQFFKGTLIKIDAAKNAILSIYLVFF